MEGRIKKLKRQLQDEGVCENANESGEATTHCNRTCQSCALHGLKAVPSKWHKAHCPFGKEEPFSGVPYSLAAPHIRSECEMVGV